VFFVIVYSKARDRLSIERAEKLVYIEQDSPNTAVLPSDGAKHEWEMCLELLAHLICTGDPVSVLVQVGGRRALVLAQVTKLSAPGQSAHFSLPSSQASFKSTTIEATILPLLPGCAG
jgi:hypothetical protein